MIEYIGGAGVYILGWYIYWLAKLKRARKPILAFHSVSDSFDLSITRNTIKGFREIMEYLRQTGYTGYSISGLNSENTCHCEGAERTKQSVETKPTAIALTFDDGFLDFYENVYPILKEYEFTATVFLISDYVGKTSTWDYQKKQHMSWDMIGEMSEHGIEFGSHGKTHVDLRSLDDKRLRVELVDSKQTIEDKTGKPVKHFSYPFGRYDNRVAKAVKETGYENAYTLSTGDGEYSERRHAAYLYDTPYSINRKVMKQSWVESCKDYVNNSLAGGTIALKKLIPKN